MRIKESAYAEAAKALKKAARLDPDAFIIVRHLASVHLRMNQKKAALNRVQTYSDAHPDHVEALLVLAELQQLINKHKDVTPLYKRAIAADPKNADAYLLLGRMQTQAGDIQSAIKTYTAMTAHIPDAFSGHFYLGRLLSETGKLYPAAAAMKESLRLRPDLITPRFKLIEIFQKGLAQQKALILLPDQSPEAAATDFYQDWNPDIQQAVERANPGIDLARPLAEGTALILPDMPGITPASVIRVYEEILSFEPENIRAAIELALYQKATGDASASRQLLAELGMRSGDVQDIIRFISDTYIEKEDYATAAILLDGMLAGAPDNASLNYLCGVARDGLKDPDAAIACFQKVPPESPFHETSMIHIAFLLREKDQMTAAIAHLTKARQAFPERINILLYLASFLEADHQLNKAEALLHEGLSRKPENPDLHFRLGVIYDKTHRKAASEKEMQTVIRLDPEHASALNYLGYSWAEAGRNLETAKTMIEKALTLKPDDGFIIDSLGWVYYQLADYEKALELLKQAVRLIDDDPTLMEHLGDAYLKLNRPADALDAYLKSRKLNTGSAPGLDEKITTLENAAP